MHLRLGLPFGVNAVNKAPGGLGSLFIRIGDAAPTGYVYIINFNCPRGDRLFTYGPFNAIGCKFSFVPDHNLVVSIFCFTWIHDAFLPLRNLDGDTLRLKTNRRYGVLTPYET
jgi:hypothetical protein